MDTPSTSTNNTNYQQWAHVVECPICYQIYDKPMQMGCGHTLCSTCVGRLVDQVKTNMAEELGRHPPQMPRLNFEENVIAGLGGMNDQLDEGHFVEVPNMDPRDPNVFRPFVRFPPHRNRNAGSTEIKCPECRKPTIVPAEGLPVNYRVQEIVQKVTPLFKDRHLVRKCTQCDAILTQGVYFDCKQCKKEKMCSTCTIRNHNGHPFDEKKALTSEDVRQMKKQIDDASARAFQCLESIKPLLEPVGGTIEKRVVDKLGSAVKVFENMINSFDANIEETSTVEQLMAEVEKAQGFAEEYQRALDRVPTLLENIASAVETFWKPFDDLKTEMKIEVKDAPVADAAPVVRPASPHPPPVEHEHRPNNIVRALNIIRPNDRAVVNHFEQVDRQRARNQRMAPRAQPGGMHLQMQMRPPPGGWGPMLPGFGPDAHRRGMMGVPQPPQPHQMQQQPQQQQQQQRMQPVPQHGPDHQNGQLMELIQMQQHQHNINIQRHLGNMPMPHMPRFQPNLLHNNVPMPPQMPNFGQHQQNQQQHPHPQNMHHQQHQQPPQQRPMQHQQHQQMMMGARPHDMPAMMMGGGGGGAPPPHPQQQQHQQQQHQQYYPVEFRRVIARPALLDGPIQPLPQQQQQQDNQQMAPPPMPEPREDIPQNDEPVWDVQEPIPNQDFNNQPFEEAAQLVAEEEEEDEDEQIQVVQVANQIRQEVENYQAAGAIDAIDMIQFGEDPLVANMQRIANEEQNQLNVGELEVNQEEQDQFEEIEGVRQFVEFQELRQVVDAIDPNRDNFVVAQEQLAQDPAEDELMNRVVPEELAELRDEEVQDEIILVEEEVAVIGVRTGRGRPRRRPELQRELAPEVDNRRNTRRSLRNNSSDPEDASTSTASTSDSDPSNGTKRRRMDKKPKLEEPKLEEPEPMDADEPVDQVPRPPKRRAAPGAPSSSGPSTSSAPTTRSQTRN